MIQPDMRERYAAYRAVLLDNGIEPDPTLVYDIVDTLYTGGEEAAHGCWRAVCARQQSSPAPT